MIQVKFQMCKIDHGEPVKSCHFRQYEAHLSIFLVSQTALYSSAIHLLLPFYDQ
jgi:hypothetical protein